MSDKSTSIALVTGSGADRVGRVIARRLAAGGCDVVLHALSSRDEAEAAADRIADEFGVRAAVVIGDLADPDVPPRIVREAAERLGGLHIAVNSAAIWSPTPLADVTADEMRRYFDVNTIAPFLIARESARVMADAGHGGSIVNIGDWATVRPYPDHAAYFPSKGAVETMTRSLAVELSRWHREIRVNAVCPGPVLLADDVPEAERRTIAESNLLGRVGTPEAVAHAVKFLCTNDFISGQCVVVDGGMRVFTPGAVRF